VGLDAKGPVESAAVFLQIPLVKTLRDRVRFDASLSTNRYRHEINAETYSRYTSDILAMGWSASAMNLLPGLNQTSIDFTLSRGRLDLSNSTAEHQALDASTVRTAGYFSKAKFGLAHRQYVTPKTSVYTSLRGQWADKNLDGSERFSLGGSGGVRAYPTGEAGGSTGGIATLELQHREPVGSGSLSLAGFYDYGEVRVNRDNDFEGATPTNEYNLRGYGLWLGAEMPMMNGGLLGLRLTWARRDGDNAGRSTLTGLDQDGTLDKDRFWLDAYYRY
jgi:hemolysin activation/secretion protein